MRYGFIEYYFNLFTTLIWRYQWLLNQIYIWKGRARANLIKSQYSINCVWQHINTLNITRNVLNETEKSSLKTWIFVHSPFFTKIFLSYHLRPYYLYDWNSHTGRTVVHIEKFLWWWIWPAILTKSLCKYPLSLSFHPIYRMCDAYSVVRKHTWRYLFKKASRLMTTECQYFLWCQNIQKVLLKMCSCNTMFWT